MLYCIKIRWDYPMEDKIMDMNLMLIIVQEKDAGPWRPHLRNIRFRLPG